MLQEQGAGIIAGDQNALNALAGYDPMAALGAQDARLGMDATRLGMDATRQQMSISAERLAMEKAEGKRMAEAAMASQAAALTAEQLAAEQKQITDALSGAASFYQKGDRAGYDAWLAKLGLDPREYAFDEFPAHAAMFEGVLEAMQTFAPSDPTKGAPSGFMFADPRNPSAGVVPLPGYTKTPDTVVNVGGDAGPQAEIGSIPQGFAAVPDPTSPAGYRMERIPGGPEDTSKADAAAAEGAIQQSNIVLEKIGQLKTLSEGASVFNPVTGLGAETAANIGGTNAANARALIDTLEANIAFDALAAMRAASPTGGALGAISERELTLLGATLSSLSQRQSPAQFNASLAQLEAIYTQIMRKAAAYPNAGEFGFGGGAAPEAPAAPGAPTPPKRLKFNPETGELE